MLQLTNIKKTYKMGDNEVKALRGVSINFRQNEFVSILGPSGCGKTTLLNLIGGLDRYCGGNLKVWDKSTNHFDDKKWDAYRNKTVGFVFQTYNLIPHINVLQNVELALTISGISQEVRKEKAIAVLKKVGLEEQINKKPNQLSGGQMQRVAIARALVNDPEIILADEPTGALDSETSKQILEILKEISINKLVIMVTHNQNLAEEYSTRIVNLLDGSIENDSHPYEKIENQIDTNTAEWKKTKPMSFKTAISLSLNNLITKKTRTIITAFAGSIGIIGIALILAVSNGFQQYIDKFQADALSSFPLEIRETATNFDFMSAINRGEETLPREEGYVIVRERASEIEQDIITNNLSEDFIENAILTIPENLFHSIRFERSFGFKIYSQVDDGNSGFNFEEVQRSVRFGGRIWQEKLDNEDFLLTQYEIVHGQFPQETNEIVLVLDKQNSLSDVVLNELGLFDFSNPVEKISFENIIGKSFRVLDNDIIYNFNSIEDKFEIKEEINQFEFNQGIEITISAIIRPKPETVIGSINSAIAYHPDLLDEIFERQQSSQIVNWMLDNEELGLWKDPMTGELFEETFSANLGRFLTPQERFQRTFENLGGQDRIRAISIYPVSFEAKEMIKDHLDAYNKSVPEEDRVFYTDMMENIISSFQTVLSGVSLVLISFTSISLFVSSILIGIISYISVIERTREIGVLRSIGARKRDITHVFNAEAFIIGLLSGIMGIALALILAIPLNIVVRNMLVDVGNVAVFTFVHVLVLISISLALTSIAGFIPSKIAANKNPVEALRSE